jgi:hypothetical protein
MQIKKKEFAKEKGGHESCAIIGFHHNMKHLACYDISRKPKISKNEPSINEKLG